MLNVYRHPQRYPDNGAIWKLEFGKGLNFFCIWLTRRRQILSFPLCFPFPKSPRKKEDKFFPF